MKKAKCPESETAQENKGETVREREHEKETARQNESETAQKQIDASGGAVSGQSCGHNSAAIDPEILRQAVEILLGDEDFLENCVTRHPCVQKAVIERYLRSRREGSGAALLTAGIGVGAMTPHPRPKNLDEAKALADYLIKSGTF